MKQYKLMKIIKLLDDDEFENLIEFSTYPLFCKVKSVYQLFLFFKETDREFTFTKLECFNKIYPQQNFSDIKFRQLFNVAFNVVEQFITIQQTNKKPILKHRVLSDFYLDKLDADFFEQENKKLESSLEKTDFLNQYFLKLEMANNELNFIILKIDTEFENKYRFKKEAIVKKIVKRFEEYVVLFTLNISTTYYSSLPTMNVMSSDYKTKEIFGEITSQILSDESKYLDDYKGRTAFDLYYHQIYIFQNQKNEEAYNYIISLLEGNKKVSAFDLAGGTYGAIFYNKAKYNETGDEKYLNKIIEVNDIQLKNKIIWHEKYIFPYSFYVLFKARVELGLIKEAKLILKKYQKFFEPRYKIGLVNFCNAIIEFEEMKYDKSLNSLYQIDFNKKNPIYLDARKLEIQIFYKKKEYDITESKINSFKALLSRESNYTKSRKRFYQDFNNFLQRIIRASPEKRTKLKEILLQKKPFESSQWLLKQLEE